VSQGDLRTATAGAKGENLVKFYAGHPWILWFLAKITKNTEQLRDKLITQ